MIVIRSVKLGVKRVQSMVIKGPWQFVVGVSLRAKRVVEWVVE